MKSHHLICLVLSVLICLSAPSGAAALTVSAPIEKSPATTIGIRWAYVSQVSTTLTISSSGTATARGQLTGIDGVTDEIWIFLYIERNVNGSWVVVDNWYQSYDSYRATLSRSVYVAAGSWYRARASYYAYAGGNSENIADTSASVYR